jgi:hypothetical protein
MVSIHSMIGDVLAASISRFRIRPANAGRYSTFGYIQIAYGNGRPFASAVYLRRGAYFGNGIGEKNRRGGAAVGPVEVRSARGFLNLHVILASQLPARLAGRIYGRGNAGDAHACALRRPAGPSLFHGGWR